MKKNTFKKNTLKMKFVFYITYYIVKNFKIKKILKYFEELILNHLNN